MNIIAATVLIKRAAVHMKGHGSVRILNIASAAGFMPGPHMAVYHARKAFLSSLYEAVSEELRGSGDADDRVSGRQGDAVFRA